MSDDPLIGHQLANFKVERVIGRGGMAQVYYGEDVKLERPVAIKIIDARHRDNPAYAERFVREARTVATWRHENVIQIYYADDEDGLYYFVMEYIDGLDLGDLMAHYVEKNRLIPPEEVIRIGQTVAAALDYAHEQNVIHRDVKPSNVLVAHDGRVVLTDFGLAMDVAQGSLGEVFGSSHYIAPEQARRSADAVPQSDLYSLGVILYEMLAGKVPFDDPSPTAVALQHVTAPPPSPRIFNPNLSLEIEQVLLKALNKTPEERYQTGHALIEALAGVLGVDLPDSAPATKPEAASASVSGGTILKKSEPSIAAGGPKQVAEAELPSEPNKDEAKSLPDDQAAVKQPPAAGRRTDRTDSLIGKKLDEYRLDDTLGRGGMARVYKGLDVQLNRLVAIKVIDTPFRTDSDYIERFKREAQTIAQLDHPHIVTVYRFGEAEGLLYLAMKYIEGRHLEAVLADYRQKGEIIPPDAASRIVREVCLALDYAHSKGVIHRDVKPSNIMLDTEDQVFLADFGLALLSDVGTRGETFGSPHYIAPEQAISSANVVPQSDLYAVGVILYQMFTGQLPFDGSDPLEVAMMHLSDPPRSPCEIRPEISSDLEAVILKALAKEPADRYPDGAAMAEALDQALQITAASAAVTPAAVPITPVPLAESESEAPATASAPATGSVQEAPAPASPSTASAPVAGTNPGKPSRPLPPIPAAVVAGAAQQGQVKSGPPPAPLEPDADKSKPVLKVALPKTLRRTAARMDRRQLIYGAAGLVLAILLIIAVAVIFSRWRGEEGSINQASDSLAGVITSTVTTQPTFTPIPPTNTPLPPTSTLTPTDAPVTTPPGDAAAFNPPPPTDTSTPTPTPSPTDTSTPPATSTPTATATSTSTATPTPIPPVADTVRDFSEVQEQTGWAYQWSKGRNSFDWTAMQFLEDDSCWHIDQAALEPADNWEDAVRICRNEGHPGLTGDIAWRWTSQFTGPIQIQVSATDADQQGGDGVLLLVYRNTNEISRWRIGGNVSPSLNDLFEMNINQGDFVFFVIKMGGNPLNDETTFQAQIYGPN